MKTLSMKEDDILNKINKKQKPFITHAQGFNA